MNVRVVEHPAWPRTSAIAFALEERMKIKRKLLLSCPALSEECLFTPIKTSPAGVR